MAANQSLQLPTRTLARGAFHWQITDRPGRPTVSTSHAFDRILLYPPRGPFHHVSQTTTNIISLHYHNLIDIGLPLAHTLYMKTTAATKTTYFKGDKAEYTGKTQWVSGVVFYEVVLIEGHLKGKTKLVVNAPRQLDMNQNNIAGSCAGLD